VALYYHLFIQILKNVVRSVFGDLRKLRLIVKVGILMFNILKKSMETQKKLNDGLITYEENISYFKQKEVMFFYYCVFSLFLLANSLFFSLPWVMTLVATVAIGVVFLILYNIKNMSGQFIASFLIPIILFLLGAGGLFLYAYFDSRK
jgi:hypothetical protein